MDAGPKPEPILNTVPLSNAVLCADCEVISDSSGEVCSVCGSRSLLSLGRVLGGSVGDERAVVLAEEEGRARRMFTVLVNREASPALRSSRRWMRPERVEKAGS
jgi:hypothetical protein